MTLIEGDCVEKMRELDEASVDAIVTDPPYGLEFMGKEWDRLWRRANNPADVARDSPHGRSSRTSPEYQAGIAAQRWHEEWATEALRILKPGGHLLAFGGTRTYHRLACAVEDAGFEIRDCLAWLYGSGFPKSHDVSKAIDKAAGVEREVVGKYQPPNGQDWNLAQADGESDDHAPGTFTASGTRTLDQTAPATPEAAQWEGWGTALKPAHEPIVVARKPLAGTVAANVLEHGTGGINVDGCRVEHDGTGTCSTKHAAGRWPANVILSPEAARELDEQVGAATATPAVPADSSTRPRLHGPSGTRGWMDLRSERAESGELGTRRRM